MSATKLTRSQQIKANKANTLDDSTKLAVAALTGRKMDREVARDAALSQVVKLLTGQAAGGNREAAVLALRACMGLEGAPFDTAFATFKGSLTDVANLAKWQRPFTAARACLAEREAAARALNIWAEAAPRFERERKLIDRAADAKNAEKVEAKAAAFLESVAEYVERAAEKLAAKASPSVPAVAPVSVPVAGEATM